MSAPRTGTEPARLPARKSIGPVTAIVLTRDEEARLPACLDSLIGWTERVIVVDSGSTDGTLEVARRFGVEIVHHPFSSYGEQRNWTLRNLEIDTPWVLNVDADERVTSELRASILRVLAEGGEPRVAGYLVSRRTEFMGRWIRHGGHYPVWHLRLFRLGKAWCEERLYDQHFIAEGLVQKLSGDLVDSFGADVSELIQRHARWAALEAREQAFAANVSRRLRGRIIAGSAIERRRWLRERYDRLPLFIRPLMYFIYRYFLRRGFLDGRAGLVFHFLQGFWYRFLVDALIYEQRIRMGNGEPPAPDAHPPAKAVR